MKIHWFDSAIDDLRSIRAYITRDNPHAAQWVTAKIFKDVDQLITFPNRGRPSGSSDVRHLIIPNTPYVVHYRVKMYHIEILRIFHSSQLLEQDE